MGSMNKNAHKKMKASHAGKSTKYQFIHIGKMGGTAINDTIKTSGLSDKIVLNGHGMSFKKILNRYPDSKVVFGYRDPIALYVSAFNSRLRQGQPRYDLPWSKAEKIAFSLFTTPNSLAEALSSAEPLTKITAEFSMCTIMHVRNGMEHYVHSVKFLKNHRDRIAFVYELENLSADFRHLLQAIEIQEDLSLPGNEVSTHKSPDGQSKELSDLAVQNLKEWYRNDYKIYKWCKEFRKAKLQGE